VVFIVPGVTIVLLNLCKVRFRYTNVVHPSKKVNMCDATPPPDFVSPNFICPSYPSSTEVDNSHDNKCRTSDHGKKYTSHG
jgi:hypothetical protein